MQIGDIVSFKNICFDDGIDHCFKNGRPCIYIGEINEKMYFVPLTNVETLKHKITYIIKPTKENRLKKDCHPNYRQLLEKKASFYETMGYLNDDEMIDFFQNILKYLKEVRSESNRISISLAKEYLNKNKIVYVDEDGGKKQGGNKKK